MTRAGTGSATARGRVAAGLATTIVLGAVGAASALGPQPAPTPTADAVRSAAPASAAPPTPQASPEAVPDRGKGRKAVEVVPCAQARTHGEYVSSVARRATEAERSVVVPAAAHTGCGKGRAHPRDDEPRGKGRALGRLRG